MSFSLPGTDLYYLPHDDLAPERYEQILSPVSAWYHIDDKYVFDNRPLPGFQLINMYERAFHGYNNQPPPHGPREREMLKNMIYHGEVVMLDGLSASQGWLFYISQHGELICRDPLAFMFNGAQKIISEYKQSVARRDYGERGGKPRPTLLPAHLAKVKPPAPPGTINSKAAGRLLAAGGIYNGNPEGFRRTAEQLGGDAPAGYDQMMSDQNKGLIIAGASIVAGASMASRFSKLSALSRKTNYPSGISFRIDQPKHLARVDGFTQQGGISGGHNAVDFYNAVKKYNLKIISATPAGVKGVTQIEYLIPAKDRVGNLTGAYRTKSEVKTIYDPAVFSDEKILTLGQQASAKGFKKAMISGNGQASVTVDGISFRIYVDKATGTVHNFHPK